MSDELECFRKAAELGCPDLKVFDDILALCVEGDFSDFDNEGRKYFAAEGQELPNKSARINRYAAAVCAEWWETKPVPDDIKNDTDLIGYTILADEMRDAARAFGRKYGS